MINNSFLNSTKTISKEDFEEVCQQNNIQIKKISKKTNGNCITVQTEQQNTTLYLSKKSDIWAFLLKEYFAENLN